MTVRELIAELEKHADANPEVIVTWEGTVYAIEPDNVYIGHRRGHGPAVLFIDADDNFYKDSFTRWIGDSQ